MVFSAYLCVLHLLISSSFVIVLGSGMSNNLPILPFDEGFTPLFGDDNLMLLRDGKSVHISLDERSGAGFISQDLYLHGYFSASIKLPTDYTAGVVVAFYLSNGDIFEKNHDELDFEFLGNIRGKNWRIQTNVYGNGSTSIGREERYGLWFDPSEDFHQYSILWIENKIIFYIDNVAIREIKRSEAMGGNFPAKPMSLYATIWDGSDWVTNGGRYKVNYKYAPYIAEFSNLVLHGCAIDPIERSSTCDSPPNSAPIPTGVITNEQRIEMENFRKNHMTYSYCYDKSRYEAPPPECVIDHQEAEHLRVFNPVAFGGVRHRHHHRGKRSHSSRTGASII